MPITSDIRSYADNAVHQGKQVLDQAQTQLGGISGQANQYVGKARENVQDIAGKAGEAAHDLRASAEKAINLEAVKSAVEPYLVQVREYGQSVTDRAEGLISGIRSDRRVSKFVDTATSVSETVVETVQQRVVKPVRSLAGIGAKPAPPSPRNPSPTPATRKANTRPTTKPVNKPAAKSTARKVPVNRAPKV